MANISALKFETPDGAEEALQTVQSLARDHLIELHDAAWRSEAEQSKTRRGSPGRVGSGHAKSKSVGPGVMQGKGLEATRAWPGQVGSRPR